MPGTWDDVARRCGTDKASSHHGYVDHYQARIEGRDVHRLLEIGVAHGNSLRLWQEVLPDALIVGVDITPECRLYQRRDIAVIVADAGNPAMMAAVSTLCGPFDVIIDDGEHDERTVRAAFEELFPRLAPGGIYFVEDLDLAEPWVTRFVADWDIDVLPVDDKVGHIAEPALLCKEAFP